MSSAESAGMSGSDMESLAAELCISPRVIEPVAARIEECQVDPAQCHDLQKTCLFRLASLRDALGEVRAHHETGHPLAIPADELLLAIESGRFDSFDTLVDLVDRMTAAADDQLSGTAAVQECRALLEASRLSYREAARIYSECGNIQDAPLELKWRSAYGEALALGDCGRWFGDDSALEIAAERLTGRVIPLARANGSVDWQFQGLRLLGEVLGMIGQRRRGTRYLEDAIASLSQACDLFDPKAASSQWAAAQNSLGNALGVLGRRQADDELLKRSAQAFELALTRFSEHSDPREWASTTNNLAAVLQLLGRKENDTKAMKRAVDAYKGVLRVWTRASAPQHWAATMDNLGTALRALGEHRKGPRTLMQSAAAYRSALSERSRDRYPGEWAMTCNNLGAALQKLAQRELDPKIMREATESYESALSECVREDTPMTWAMAMANLGVARRELAEMTGDAGVALQAVEAIQCAVDVFRDASHAQYTELGEEQLALARGLRDELNADPRPET